MKHRQTSLPFLIISLSLVMPVQIQATGLNFWEGSALNSALANANGAKARDASVQAMVPASITQLETRMITANLTYYQVETDYKIFGQETDYSVSNPIPSGFLSTPLNDDWSFGLGIYSRTAADISVPSIRLVHPKETRLQPITVSIAPTIAYQYGNISLAITGEYIVSEHKLYQTQCVLAQCNTDIQTGNTSGINAAFSATWQANDTLSLAIMHRLGTDFNNADIDFSLPAITSIYANFSLMDNLHLDINYSLSRWKNKGIEFTEYPDVLGLLIGDKDSNRIAVGIEYQHYHWFWRAGYSIDEAIDTLGGYDKRYRLGLGYQITPTLNVDLTGFKESYAIKEFSAQDISLVRVQNKGDALSMGLTYQF